MSRQSNVSPVVLAALTVLCEASENQLMDSLAEFRVAHRSRPASLMIRHAVAEGFDAYRQRGGQPS